MEADNVSFTWPPPSVSALFYGYLKLYSYMDQRKVEVDVLVTKLRIKQGTSCTEGHALTNGAMPAKCDMSERKEAHFPLPSTS